MVTRRNALVVAAAGMTSAILGHAPRAWPQGTGKIARIVVGFPPGGSVDVIARHLGERLRGTHAASVIVENKPGAGGRIAAEGFKHAEPDGHTILLTPNPMITLYPHIYRKLAYDPLRDFSAVSSVCNFPLVLVAGPAVPAEVKSIEALVNWARRNPAKAAYGTSAAGSTQHFIGSVFARGAGIELTHVAYKGGGQAMPDLLSGQLPMLIGTPPNVMPNVRSGKLRVLAATGPGRSSLLPEVPTFKEVGFADLEVTDWMGMFVPARTSPDLVAKLNAAVREAVQSKEVADAFARIMVEPSTDSAAECARRVSEEHRMWGAVVKASGFVGED